MTDHPRAVRAQGLDMLPGFADPVFDAQAIFRAVMNATAYPGRIVTMDRSVAAPAPLNSATAGFMLCLLDMDTPLWLDGAATQGQCPAWLRFHTGVALAASESEAKFVLASDVHSLPLLDRLMPGSDDYPDRSATLLIQVPSLTEGRHRIWRGPGIRDEIGVAIAGLPDAFWESWELNHELYPSGIDVFFTCGSDLVGLPRSVRVEV